MNKEDLNRCELVCVRLDRDGNYHYSNSHFLDKEGMHYLKERGVAYICEHDDIEYAEEKCTKMITKHVLFTEISYNYEDWKVRELNYSYPTQQMGVVEHEPENETWSIDIAGDDLRDINNAKRLMAKEIGDYNLEQLNYHKSIVAEMEGVINEYHQPND